MNTDNTEKPVIIGGGQGPMAGVIFHRKIIEHTRADRGDRDMLEVFHVSCSRWIEERMAFLNGESNENPATGMYRALHTLSAGLQELDTEVVIAIPCNTFHAPSIFKELSRLLEFGMKVPFTLLNIIEVTASQVALDYPTKEKIGVISTVGSRDHKIFHKPFEALNKTVIEVSQELQKEVSEIILDVKAKNKVQENHISALKLYCEELKAQEAEVVILGCSELSLIFMESPIEFSLPIIDPVEILARKTIEVAAGSNRLTKLKTPSY